MKGIWVFFLLMPVTFLTLTAGCGKKEADTDEDRPRDKFVSSRDKGSTVAAGRGEPLKAPLDGLIRGRVVLQGERPETAIDDKAMIDKMTVHNDHAGCLAGTDLEKKSQKWMIDENNGVANVVISLKAPAGKYFQVKEEDKKLAGKKVELRQPHCAFKPHVVGIFPSYWDGKALQRTGEEFVVINDAPFNHNTAWVGSPLTNPRGSQTISPKSELQVKLVPESNPIQISCDIHPWMYARVWAFDHPYFAVTKSDGTFEIKEVPTGVELGLVAWHEARDFFHGGKGGVKQTFKPGENKVDLTISAK